MRLLCFDVRTLLIDFSFFQIAITHLWRPPAAPLSPQVQQRLCQLHPGRRTAGRPRAAAGREPPAPRHQSAPRARLKPHAAPGGQELRARSQGHAVASAAGHVRPHAHRGHQRQFGREWRM